MEERASAARGTGTRTAQGKAKQRARGKAVEAATGLKGHQSGTSGITAALRQAHRREWADVEDHVVHSCDIAGYIADFRVLASRQGSAYIVVPSEYVTDLLKAMMDSSRNYAFVRIYIVPRSVFHDAETLEAISVPVT